MAQFETTGLEGLELSMEDLAQIPDGIIEEMLFAEGEIIKDAQIRKLHELGMVRTGQLAESISVERRVKGSGSARYIIVAPHGKRRDGKTSNSEVGFIQEVGAPRRNIKARQWMRKANEESAGDAVNAAERVYDNWLKSKGL